MSEPFIAKHNSICPCCDKYIRAGRSKIAALPIPLTPTDKAARFYNRDDDHRGYWTVKGTSRSLPMHPHQWAHARCAESVWRLFDKDEPAVNRAEVERASKVAAVNAEMKRRRADVEARRTKPTVGRNETENRTAAMPGAPPIHAQTASPWPGPVRSRSTRLGRPGGEEPNDE